MPESLYRPRPEKWFQVGIGADPQAGDNYYDDEREAIERASQMHNANDWRTPIAIWNERFEIVYLFFCNQQFRRM